MYSFIHLYISLSTYNSLMPFNASVMHVKSLTTNSLISNAGNPGVCVTFPCDTWAAAVSSGGDAEEQ